MRGRGRERGRERERERERKLLGLLWTFASGQRDREGQEGGGGGERGGQRKV